MPLSFPVRDDGGTFVYDGCEQCGGPGHSHKRVRVSDGEGRFHYRYLCPSDDREEVLS